MQPRGIGEVLDSIKNNINIKTFCFKLTQNRTCVAINDFISQTQYSHYIISADDILYNKNSTDGVLSLSQQNIEKIVTGWVNLYIENNNYSELSNVCLNPLTLINDISPTYADYRFSKMEDVMNMGENLFMTYLISFAFSCIPRNIILKYPMMPYCYKFKKRKRLCCASDHHFSFRYYNNTKMGGLTNKYLFFHHLKQHISNPYKKDWLVGRIKSQIIEYII